MTVPRTLADRLWDLHSVEALPDRLSLLAIDRTFLHERTGAAALRGLRERQRAVLDPTRVFCTMDHIVDTRPGRGDEARMPGGSVFITETRAMAREAGIRVFDVQDPDQGIVHVIAPELGIVQPGMSVACPDSHTCTQGALGTLAFGIGSSEAEHALATGTLRLAKPRNLRVSFGGRLDPAVTAKDLCLLLLSRHGSAGGNGFLVEYAGSVVRALDMEARLTLCNMTTEFSAVTGLIAPDDTTLDYLYGRPFAPAGAAWEQAALHWRSLRSHDDAGFDREISIDVTGIGPMVSWGTNPQQSVSIHERVPDLEHSGSTREAYQRALDYMGLAPGTPLSGLPIDAAFIGSCTNSRLTDLRRAASVLKGRHIAAHVRAVCVPGSTTVKRQAEREGLDRIFTEAGFEWHESGCSMCFYAGGDSFGLRSRVISSTNRNFESRQGPETRTHIASPETVAASAIAGCISAARPNPAPP
jgi:3-isopropylmalate/(R)-2-methylmalate dehydratase large subunit